jgi:hypothetical protein
MESGFRPEPLLMHHRTDKAAESLKVNADVGQLLYSAIWQSWQRLDV